MTMASTTASPSMERLKCAGKITGVTAKWVVGWPVIGVYQYGRSVRQWHKTGRVSRSTTTFLPDFCKPAQKCSDCNTKLDNGSSNRQGTAEKVLKGMGLTLWWTRVGVVAIPYCLVKECRQVHMDHKQKMYAKEC